LKKKIKPFSKSASRRKLHVLWSKRVRERDRYVCQWCWFDGRYNQNLCNHAHHIVPVSLCGTAGQYVVGNGVTLCYYCHINRLKSEVDEYIAFRDSWLREHSNVDYFTLRSGFRVVVKFTEEFFNERWKSLGKR
jgi:hypothetical protein